MQILVLLGISFGAVVVEVKTFFTFIQICSGHTVNVAVLMPNSIIKSALVPLVVSLVGVGSKPNQI